MDFHKPSVATHIEGALYHAKEPKSREEALVKTKLEEAWLWLSQVEDSDSP